MRKNQLISGAFFAVYTILQMFLQKYVWENAVITTISISMLLESAAILAFAAIAVYLLCFEVSEAKKKAIALAGVLYIIYVGLYFSVHQSLAMMGLINIGNLMKNDGAIYAVIAVKVLLVAAAVVFLLLGEMKQNETAELAEEPAAEEAATPAEPVEEEKPVEETQEPEPAE